MMRLSLTGKAGYIALGKALASVSSLAAGAILSRYLTKDAYGTYRQLWLIYNTVHPLIALGIPTSISYFIPQLKEAERGAFNLQTFTFLTLGGGALSILFFFGGSLMTKTFHNPDLLPVARLFALVPVLTLPTLYYQNLFICLDRPLLVAGLSAGLAFGRLLSVITPVVMGCGLDGVLIGLLVFSFFQFFVVTCLMFQPFGLRVKAWSLTLLIQQFRYAFPIGVASIVGMLTKQLDKIVIASFFTAAQYAIYANGAIEIPLIGVITSSVMAVLMPKFVELNLNGEQEKLIKLWHNAIRKVALIILPVMVFLLIYAPESLTLLFSSKYRESANVFRIYLLSLPNRVTTFGTILLSLGLSRLVMLYSFYALVLNVGLNYLLVMTVGFLGPAIGTLVAIYFVNYLQLRKISSLMNSDLSSIFPWQTLGRIAAATLIAGLISSWPKVFCSYLAAVWVFLLGAATYTVSFSIGSLWSGIMKKHELKVILKEVLRRGGTRKN